LKASPKRDPLAASIDAGLGMLSSSGTRADTQLAYRRQHSHPEQSAF
jgi:hypothetical protein